MYPTLPGLLHALSQGPVLTTVGVNPDLLQFYLSQNQGKPVFMAGSYQHYYVTGVLDAFGAHENQSYLALDLPAHHPLSKRIFYPIDADCFASTTRLRSDCACDASLLAAYAYSVEVEALVPFLHTLSCRSVRAA